MTTTSGTLKTVFLGIGAVAIIGFGAWALQGNGSPPASAAESAASQQPAAGNDGGRLAAQSPSGKPAKPWNTRCSEEPHHCEIVQKLLVKETGQRFAEFAIGYPEGKDDARGVLILPLGILLEKPVNIRVDENAPFKVSVRYCAPQGCLAFLDMNDEIVQQMKKGTSAMITFQNAQGRTLNLPITLTGFTDAIDGLKAS